MALFAAQAFSGRRLCRDEVGSPPVSHSAESAGDNLRVDGLRLLQRSPRHPQLLLPALPCLVQRVLARLHLQLHQPRIARRRGRCATAAAAATAATGLLQRLVDGGGRRRRTCLLYTSPSPRD